MPAPSNERWTAPTGCPPVPTPQQEDRAIALFHALAAVMEVENARLLINRLLHLQSAVREAEESAIRFSASRQVQSLGRIDNLLQERAR